jgi:hypothetical protein
MIRPLGETLMNIALKSADQVRRREALNDRAHGPILSITRIYPGDDFSICELSDGSTAFDFELRRESCAISFIAPASALSA